MINTNRLNNFTLILHNVLKILKSIWWTCSICTSFTSTWQMPLSGNTIQIPWLFKFFWTINNPLRANPTKWSNTLEHFVGKLPTNCLSVFDHFVGLGLVLKALTFIEVFAEAFITNVCVSGDKKCSFFGKFDVPCFFVTPLLRFALLPYYRQIVFNSSFGLVHISFGTSRSYICACVWKNIYVIVVFLYLSNIYERK